MSEAETAIRRLHDLGIPSDRILLRNLADGGPDSAGAGVFLSAKVTPEQASEASYILKGGAAQPPMEKTEAELPRPDPVPSPRQSAPRREATSEKASWPPPEARPIRRQAEHQREVPRQPSFAGVSEKPPVEERRAAPVVRNGPLRLVGLFVMLILIGLALGYVIGLMA